MYVYDLTPLTRQAKSERRFAWQGFDLPRRQVYIVMVTTVVMLPLVAMFYALLGIWVVFLVVVGYALPLFLIESRTSDGMKLRRINSLYDQRVSNTGKFIICNRQIEPLRTRVRVLRAASVPVDQVARAEQQAAEADLFG